MVFPSCLGYMGGKSDETASSLGNRGRTAGSFGTGLCQVHHCAQDAPGRCDPTSIRSDSQSMVLPSREQEGPTETDRIERATKLAAGYDYAAATTALAGIEGAQAQKVIDPRRPKSE